MTPQPVARFRLTCDHHVNVYNMRDVATMQIGTDEGPIKFPCVECRPGRLTGHPIRTAVGFEVLS